MKLALLTTITHRTGSWPVYLISEMTESDDKTYMAEFNSLPVSGRILDTPWKSTGAAVAYLKRLANHTPDRSSVFVLIPWNGTYTIYFQDRDTTTFAQLMECGPLVVVPGYTVIPSSTQPVEEVDMYDNAMPKTIGERVEKLARIFAAAQNQLRATDQVNHYGNMVKRYAGNLRRHTKARNALYASTEIIYRGIYEDKPASAPLVPAAPPVPAVTLPAGPKSWINEVIADNSGKWCSNACHFATKEEADAYGRDLFGRWTLVREFRAAPSDEPVNYRWDAQKGAVSLNLCPLCGERRGEPGTHKC